MTYKEFIGWCNRRAADGYWPLTIALTCCEEASKIHKLSFFKRRKMMKTEVPKMYTDLVESVNDYYGITEVD